MTSYANSKLYDSFESAGITGVLSQKNQQKLHCPNCSETRKNKRDLSLFLSPKKGLWKCFNCDWTGGLKNPDYVANLKEKREYTIPVERKLPLGDKVIKWFEDRGIEKRTLEYFKIGESSEENQNWINFPYYRDNTLVNVKRRSAKKDFRMSPNAELIFYNLDSIFDRKEIIITEGEIDCLSIWQADFFHVTSVPNGAQKGNAKMEYLDNCFEYFEDSTKVILCIDNDEAGRYLQEELCRRIGREKCWLVSYPEGCKDANEVLKKHGNEGVRELVLSAKPHPVSGINKPMEYHDDVLDFHHDGFPKSDKIGFPSLDEMLSYRLAELTIITGVPGSSKSCWLNQVLLRLSVRHGWKHGILSREQFPHSIHMMKLVQAFTNKSIRKGSGITPEMITKSMKFLDEHLFLFGIDDLTLDGIINRAKQLVLVHGIKSLIIDPWNTLDHDMRSAGSETEYIRQALKKICDFKDKYSVHVFIVAHPTKIMTNNNGVFNLPTLYSISGSSHWYNMADNGICVYRNKGTGDAKADPLGDTVSIHIQKVRNFFVGKLGIVTFDFNYKAETYAEEGAAFECEYDNWLYKTRQTSESPVQILYPQELPQLTDINKLPIGNSFSEEPVKNEIEKEFEQSFYNEDGSLKPNLNIDPGF